MILKAKNSAGAAQAVNTSTGYMSLATGTFYVPINPGDVAEIHALQIQCTSGAVLSDCHLEACCFDDTADYGADLSWVTLNPASAVVPVTGSMIATAAVVTGSAGSALYNIAGLGSYRLRLVFTLSTGGSVRVGSWKGNS